MITAHLKQLIDNFELLHLRQTLSNFWGSCGCTAACLRLVWRAFTMHRISLFSFYTLGIRFGCTYCTSICRIISQFVCPTDWTGIGSISISIDDFIAITRTKYFSAIHLLSVPSVIVVASDFVIVVGPIIRHWHKPEITTEWRAHATNSTGNCCS